MFYPLWHFFHSDVERNVEQDSTTCLLTDQHRMQMQIQMWSQRLSWSKGGGNTVSLQNSAQDLTCGLGLLPRPRKQVFSFAGATYYDATRGWCWTGSCSCMWLELRRHLLAQSHTQNGS